MRVKNYGDTFHKYKTRFKNFIESTKKGRIMLVQCVNKKTNKEVPIIFKIVKGRGMNRAIPIAKLLSPAERKNLITPLGFEPQKPKPKFARRLAAEYTDNMLSILFQDLMGTKTPFTEMLDTDQHTELSTIKKELTKLHQRLGNLVKSAAVKASLNTKLINSLSGINYFDGEKSYHDFLNTKETKTVKQYLQRIDAYEEPEEGEAEENFPGFEGVENVLLYDHDNPIYELGENSQWWYDYDHSPISKRYVLFPDGEKAVGFDNLHHAEKMLYKSYLKEIGGNSHLG